MASRTRMLCGGGMMRALTALLLLINRVAGGMIEVRPFLAARLSAARVLRALWRPRRARSAV